MPAKTIRPRHRQHRQVPTKGLKQIWKPRHPCEAGKLIVAVPAGIVVDLEAGRRPARRREVRSLCQALPDGVRQVLHHASCHEAGQLRARGRCERELHRIQMEAGIMSPEGVQSLDA